ncbi:MAG: ATP-binding protein [Spirochaetales bacterium]|nr:ATP-binding protein [Spirochaetales bacterium]
MKKLPTGIQTFSKIREDNYAYVDKTEDIYSLIQNGTYYFLSRPRRFGKSLLIDTIAELFKGSKEYFKGLYIYDKWDWDVKYPVIKINFGGGDYSTSQNLENEIIDILYDISYDFGIKIDNHLTLKRLIKEVYKKYGQKVAILIDEYDKPIIDTISNKETALENKALLGSFYSAIKASDQYVKFAMLTGVSKFSKVNLFSNLNNLTDITISKKYGTITGYTQNDLDTTFSEHLKGVDMEEVQRWYNGYNYFAEAIYNPYDILQFIDNDCTLKNYWWETGNPGFLIEKLRLSNFYIPKLEDLIVGEETLNTFDVERIDLIALLWQTGYLTFDKEIIGNNKINYKMKIPNIEIQNSLYSLFYTYLTDRGTERVAKELELQKACDIKDLEKLKSTLKSLFSAIPYNNYVKNELANYEGYYSSVIYTFLSSLGYDTVAEDVTNKGRIDLTLKTKNAIFIFEFKVDSKEGAIKQIKERKYYEKYQAEDKEIYMIGINFDSELKNIAEIKWERV